MIELQKVNKTYNTNAVSYLALDNINLTINEGEFLAITGKSGAGKSTLLHLIAGIDNATEGKIVISGKDIVNIRECELASFRKRNIGIVLQDYCLIEDFSIKDNIKIPLVGSKLSKKMKDKKCCDILSQLGILELLDKQINKLSGGEKQRVAIARALISNPNIILADEPTGSLDSNNSNQILDILSNINKDGKTVIIVTHDKDIAALCNRVIELSDGIIIKDYYN